MKKVILIISFLSIAILSQAQIECCFGGNATLTASGGTSYVWSNGPTTAVNANVGAGTYTVTVTDANGCTATASETVSICPELVASCSGTDNTSCSSPNGTVTVSASGGCDGSYTYSWDTSPVQTTATATGLGMGTYTVTVTDVAGCTGTCSVTIDDDITPPTANITGSCN